MTTADLTAYRAVHTAIRRAPHRMARAVLEIRPGDRRRVDAFCRYWHGYAAEVLAHHTIEDDIVFPALATRAEAARALIERTDADHHLLDDLMERCAKAMATLEHDAGLPVRERVAGELRALGALMDEHLDFEDEHILPLITEHFDHDEYATLEEQATKTVGVGAQAAFTVPFIIDAVDGETRAHLFASAPMAMRVLYRVCRGRHARLDARALGAVRMPVAVGA
jgi:hemerythrin-like domain-containing protein